MKLRNKKTGEIRNAVDIDMYTDSVYLKVSDGEFDNETIEYRSLAGLNEEWEDVPEEPKKYWYIDTSMMEVTYNTLGTEPDVEEFNKKIGNYFDTQEEAELAVEKLKAWKRLKDKGFINEQVFSMNLNWCNPDDDDWKAFKLLFGGEE